MSLSTTQNSLLSRAGHSMDLNPLQLQVDSAVESFALKAADWKSLAAMTAGGLAYRAGRLGGAGWGKSISTGLGLGAEVSAFEFTHRGLSSIFVGAHGRAPLHANLWRWNGSSGLAQGLLQSFVTFGTLKGAGRLAQGENLIAQHLFQDSALILSHRLTGALGLSSLPEGSLSEQFLHAEAANLQMAAGMALGLGFAPGLQGFQIPLERPVLPFSFLQGRARETFAYAGPNLSHEKLSPPAEKKGPEILQMSAQPSATGFTVDPPEILVNGSREESGRRLDRILRLVSDKDVSSRKLLPLLYRYPPGYRLKRLGFVHLSDGRLNLQGEVEKIGGFTIADFDRMLVRNPDTTRSPLYAIGQGLDVAYLHRRNGIGTSVVLNELEFYQALGIPYFLVPVGRWGGAFWPKVGFDFADPSIRESMLRRFREHLNVRLIDPSRLGPLPLETVRHSWNLLNLHCDQGREVGKGFLLDPFHTWDSLFKLYDSDYPGWPILRRAAEKIGREPPG